MRSVSPNKKRVDAGAVVLAILFLVFQYKLRKKQMDYAFQYRQDIMQKTGMLLLEDNTVINSEGKVVSRPWPVASEVSGIETEKVTLLPKNQYTVRHR